MKIGRYTVTVNSVLHKFFHTVNSASYWEARFKRDWITSGGRVQSVLFATGFALNLPESLVPASEIASVLDFGCATGDSAPVLKIRFPAAKISLWDFSTIARSIAEKQYSGVGEILSSPPQGKYDLVYCSNVVEHIQDLEGFLRGLDAHVGRYLVIQAPFNERHTDGNFISPQNRLGEHVRTVDAALTNNAALSGYEWATQQFRVPYAWDKGEQILMVGRKK